MEGVEDAGGLGALLAEGVLELALWGVCVGVWVSLRG